MAIEEVVAEDEGGATAGDEIRPDREGLREAVGARLFGVAKFDAPARAVAQRA
jgi:hypothetical protein